MIGEDVLLHTGVEGAHGEHCRVCGRHPPGHQGLERRHQLRPGQKGVCASLRLCAVGGKAVEADGKGIGGGVEGAVAHAHLSHREIRPDMGAEDGVHPRKAPGVHHPLGAAIQFFVGLEQEPHPAGKLRPAQELGRAQKPCHVEVVAAGVHHARHL